jgi:glycosyltransferase involved in cell wall biosynthesis
MSLMRNSFVLNTVKQGADMKIAQIAPPWLAIPPKTYGGTESVVADLIEEQIALGHDVTLFAPGDARTSARLVSYISRSLREEGVPWVDSFKAYYFLQRSIEAASSQDFDIIHMHLSAPADLYLFPLSANLTTPHVTTLHSRFPFDRVQSWRGDADTYFLERWGASVPLVAISESARREVPPAANVVGVVYNGISTKQYGPSTKARGDYLAWLGRFTPDKGPHLACEAARRAGKLLILAGTIDRAQQESMRYFHEVIEPLIDNQHVRYIGPANRKQKIDLFSRAYGFLNPIEWEEPFGMVMIEAMALGCPVISFSRGAAPELVLQGETGFLVQNLEEMVERIPQLAQIDRERTRQHVERSFSARVMADHYVRLYQRLRYPLPDNTFVHP